MQTDPILWAFGVRPTKPHEGSKRRKVTDIRHLPNMRLSGVLYAEFIGGGLSRAQRKYVKVTEASLTYVALDENGQPRPLPNPEVSHLMAY